MEHIPFEGMIENYAQVGGLRIGVSFWMSMNYSIPIAKICCYKDAIIIKVRLFVLSKEYKIARSGIRSIVEFRGLISKGVRIIHTDSNCPSFVVFWTTDLDELKANLAMLAFPFQEEI